MSVFSEESYRRPLIPGIPRGNPVGAFDFADAGSQDILGTAPGSIMGAGLAVIEATGTIDPDAPCYARFFYHPEQDHGHDISEMPGVDGRMLFDSGAELKERGVPMPVTLPQINDLLLRYDSELEDIKQAFDYSRPLGACCSPPNSAVGQGSGAGFLESHFHQKVSSGDEPVMNISVGNVVSIKVEADHSLLKPGAPLYLVFKRVHNQTDVHMNPSTRTREVYALEGLPKEKGQSLSSAYQWMWFVGPGDSAPLPRYVTEYPRYHPLSLEKGELNEMMDAITVRVGTIKRVRHVGNEVNSYQTRFETEFARNSGNPCISYGDDLEEMGGMRGDYTVDVYYNPSFNVPLSVQVEHATNMERFMMGN